MALPEKRFKLGVQSAGMHGGRYSTSGTSQIMQQGNLAMSALKEGQARQEAIDQMTQNAMTSLAHTAAKMGYDIYEDQVQNEINSATDEISKAEVQWQQVHGEKEEYSPDEIPEHIIVNRTEKVYNSDTGELEDMPRQIPAHEVQAQLYKDYMDKITDAATSRVSSSRTKDEWARKVHVSYANRYGQMLIDSEAQRKKYWNEQNLAAYTQALADGRYDVAFAKIDQLDIKPNVKEEFKHNVRVKQETDFIYGVAEDGSLEDIQGEIKRLGSDYKGPLDNQERRYMKAVLKDEHKTRTAVDKSQLKAKKDKLQFDITSATTLINGGYGNQLTAEDYSRLVSDGKAAGFDKEVHFLQVAFKSAPFIREMQVLPGMGMETIKKYEKSAGADPFVAINLREQFENIKHEYRTDWVSTAGKYQIFKDGVGRVGDPNFVQQRMRAASTMLEMGVPINKWFSPAEVTYVKDQWRNMKGREKLQFVEQLTPDGKYYEIAVEQLKLDRDLTNTMWSYQNMKHGHHEAATHAMNGAEMIEQDPEQYNPILDKARNFLKDQHGALFLPGDPNIEGLAHAYVGANIGLNEDGNIKPQKMQELMNDTLGEPLRFNDTIIFNIPNLKSSDELDRLLINMDNDYLVKNHGNPMDQDGYKIPIEEYKRKLHKGLIYPAKANDNQLRIIGEDGQPLLRSDSGEVFLITAIKDNNYPQKNYYGRWSSPALKLWDSIFGD